jgi:topoisomerase-4 subunit A
VSLSLSGNAKVMRVIKVDDLENQFVAVTTNRGRLLVFPISELPVLSKGKGNKLIQIPSQEMKSGEEFVVSICFLLENQNLIYLKKIIPFLKKFNQIFQFLIDFDNLLVTSYSV